MQIINILLDILLIGLLGVGIAYAIKLTRQLADMRASRTEMERFVLSFNATVDRAESGIRGLKAAARDSGDDLEKLIDKAHALRDELHFLTESADQAATRLSGMASAVARAATPTPPATPRQQQAAPQPTAVPDKTDSREAPTSAAERELLRILTKRG